MSYPRLESLRVADLKCQPDGLRVAEQDAVHRVAVSVKALGLLKPPTVSARTGRVLDGVLLVQALRGAGQVAVHCWVVDVDPAVEDAAHMALNNHYGEWVWQAVSGKLLAEQAKGTLPLCGFHECDSGPLVAADWSPAAKGPIDGSDPNQMGLFG